MDGLLTKVMGLIGGMFVTVATAEVLLAVPVTRSWIASRLVSFYPAPPIRRLSRRDGDDDTMGRLPLIIRV